MTALHPASEQPDSGGWAEAIDALPLAVVIVSPAGVIDAGNRAFHELCGAVPAGTALADVVARDDRAGVTDLTAVPDDALIGLASGRSARITTRELAAGRRVVCLRTVDHDAQPAIAPAGPMLHIGVLGRSRIDGRGEPARWLDQRPGQLLRLLVATRDTGLTTDAITEALWPGGEARSPATVRYLVHTLRSQLEPDREGRGAPSIIRSHRGGYRLDVERVVLDADLFERETRDGLAAHGAGGTEIAGRLLERAVGRYRGDFLSEEPYADWAAAERERLRELMGRALRALGAIAQASGDLERATEHLARLAALEPLDVGVQREVIALCLRRGRRGEAERRYEALRRRAASGAGEPLGFTLEALSAALTAG